MQEIESIVRPLTPSERRLLTSALKFSERRLKKFPKRILITGLCIFGVLWLLTLIASHGLSYLFITAFWIILGGSIGLWVYFEEKPKEELYVRNYESGLKRNEARVFRIQSNQMVEFEEREDEGACYAFQIAGNRIVFISGQDFYASVRFPNSDFSLIHVYREDGVLLEGFIEKHGTKLRPSRKISSKMKEKMKVPDHLQVIDGTLDQLESLLALASMQPTTAWRAR